MKIIVAPDSFKESLDAVLAAQTIAQGIKDVYPQAQILQLPIADGGEGTVVALVAAGNGQFQQTMVKAPLGNPTQAQWGILADGTAVIEMAAASGLNLVPSEKRNPLHTCTYGTGELIKAAMDKGCKKIILGIGGSATNDGGAGAIRALGARLLDSNNNEIPPGGEGLLALSSIDTSQVDPRLQQTQIEIACDVNNPLLGERGASKIYGPQKGATPGMIETLEKALSLLAQVAKDKGKDIASFPGSGAAGGFAAGLSLVTDIQIRPGIELVLDTLEFSKHLEGADLVITAEGRIDAQSAMGKAVSGIGEKAKGANIPVIALCGTLSPDYQAVYQAGISAVIPIMDSPMSLNKAMANTQRLLTQTATRVMRLIETGSRLAKG